MKTTPRRRRISPCLLTLSIASAICAPDIALADSGQQLANGIDLTLAAGNYSTRTIGEHTLWATLGGTMDSAGLIHVSASGANANAVRADGLGSQITFGGGSFDTTGSSGSAIAANGGGAVRLNRDSTGLGAQISTTSFSAFGAYSTGNGSLISLTNAIISTQGIGSVGALAEGGASVVMDGGSITTMGDNADTTAATNGASTQLNNVTLVSNGIGARGANVHDSGSIVQISNSSITTNGRESDGVLLGVGGRAHIDHTTIHTGGDFAYGINLNGNGSRADLDQLDISTSGVNASAIWAPSQGGIVNASNVTLATSGNQALGVDNRASLINLDTASIVTTGTSSHGLYASKEFSGDASIDGTNVTVRTQGDRSIGAVARLGGGIALSASSITTFGDSASGVVVAGESQFNGVRSTIETHGANALGLQANNLGAMATLVRSQLLTHGAAAHGVTASHGGIVSMTNSSVQTDGDAAWAGVVDGDGSRLSVDGGSLLSTQYAALASSGATQVALSNGAQAVGGNGTLLHVDNVESGHAQLTLDTQSYAQGDIVGFDVEAGLATPDTVAPLADVALSNGSRWMGATSVVDDLSLASDSIWTLTGDSHIGQLTLDDASIVFTPPSAGAYKTLNIAGDFGGSGGVIAMNTYLNDGGARANQQSDRLLIQGNVITTGTTLLDVTPQGQGALTDTNKNNAVDANEGISLVQVAGDSRADAFALEGGYVAAGPWQYTLHAFGPGQVDAEQNALANGELKWDYRLGNTYVDDSGEPGEPGGPGTTDPNNPEPGDSGNPEVPVVPPVDPATERPAVVPQLPSYIVAPTALLNYGGQLIDTLHQRLGEIRNVSAGNDLSGEVFVRYLGSQQRYHSDRSFTNYGYDFDQQLNALQLGGSLVGWTGDQSSLRAGWAADSGTTRVTPSAADGQSYAKYDANGFSAWLTWQAHSGFYLDGVIGGDRFKGKVSTAARGSDVATIRAHGWTASVETGYPFALAAGWSIEPQAQLKYQSITFNDITDVDGLLTRIAPTDQTSVRLGARLAKTNDPRLAPYARADVIRTIGGRAQITTSSDAWNISNTFAGGRVGTSYRLGAGVTSQLTAHIALYGEADYLHDTGGHGLSGWSADAGLRINF